ncbi:MAG: hypothetical protein RL372_742 [Bacteroidota bacterium]|jgi:peroxiredoxin
MKLLLFICSILLFNNIVNARGSISILIYNKTEKVSYVITDDLPVFKIYPHDSIRLSVDLKKVVKPNGFSIQYMKMIAGKESGQNYFINIFESVNKERIIVDSAGDLYFKLPNNETIYNQYFYQKIRGDNKNIDSLIFVNKSNLVAAKILYSKYVLGSIDIKTIDSLYTKLDYHVKKTLLGREIFNYINDKEGNSSFIEGSKIKNISLPDLNNKLIKLSEFKSNYILLDFWFAGCIPCIRNFDTIKTVYSKFDRKYFQIIAISIDKKSNKNWWSDIISRRDYSWINLIDSDQEVVAKYFKITEFPSSILLDNTKKIVKINPTIEELRFILLKDSDLNKLIK